MFLTKTLFFIFYLDKKFQTELECDWLILNEVGHEQTTAKEEIQNGTG